MLTKETKPLNLYFDPKKAWFLDFDGPKLAQIFIFYMPEFKELPKPIVNNHTDNDLTQPQ